MLASAQVQRFVRQILIPEVGRAGQERWVESRIEVSGAGPTLDAAIELVAAAGVAVGLEIIRDTPTPASPSASPGGGGQPTVASDPVLAQLGNLWLSNTAFADRRAACAECLAAFFAAQPQPPPEERAAASFATGAAAAAEALLQLLDPSRPPIAMAFTPDPRRALAPREGCACGR